MKYTHESSEYKMFSNPGLVINNFCVEGSFGRFINLAARRFVLCALLSMCTHQTCHSPHKHVFCIALQIYDRMFFIFMGCIFIIILFFILLFSFDITFMRFINNFYHMGFSSF